MKLESTQQIFEKSSNSKFHENPSSESRAGRKTYVTKLIVAFRKSANAPKIARRRSASQTSLLSAYVLDTRILGHESDVVRSQRVERYYYTDVALNVQLWGEGE
jgi:hypothetical protein